MNNSKQTESIDRLISIEKKDGKSKVTQESTSYKAFKTCNYIIMILIVLVTLYPFVSIISLSLSQEQFIIAGKVNLLPKGLNMEAYKLVFSHPSFLVGYRNTILYTIIGVIINLFMTTICAYPLSKKHLPGRSIFIKLIVFTMFFSGGLIPNFLLVRSLKMYNTIWAVTVPGAVAAWNVIIMITFFQGIPDALEDAAYIDGLGMVRTLWYIILPLSKPIFATMTLFFAVAHWNDWFGPLVYFNQNDKYPITLFLRNILMSAQQLAVSQSGVSILMGEQEILPSESLKSAAVILVTAPILVLYPFVQKYFVKGMLIGSVK